MPTEQQKAELIALLNGAAALRLNAVVFQVRPACDALYKSPHEPWSEYLTGQMGLAPAPQYDPLEFAVREAHARGLELHAWFNPYRAGHPSRKSLSAQHVSKRNPKWVKTYGKQLWLDPGEPAVRDYTAKVILDVVRRYDIDGVHLDDYFYPYQERDGAGQVLDFPDEASWQRYRSGGGKLKREDWRRENVNQLIERLYRDIKAAKRWVQFGISPFGIWRPGQPAQIRGLDAYEALYADARLWLQKGWLDYLAPQLYWAIKPPEQSFPVLFDWWQQQNEKQRPIWPGGAVTKVGKPWPPEEILQQIEITRQAERPGYIHWNLGALLRNRETLGEKLLAKSYSNAALPPAADWLSSAAPKKPELQLKIETNGARFVTWQMSSNIVWWVLQTKEGAKWRTQILPTDQTRLQLNEGSSAEAVAVTAVDRYRLASPAALLLLNMVEGANRFEGHQVIRSSGGEARTNPPPHKPTNRVEGYQVIRSSSGAAKTNGPAKKD